MLTQATANAIRTANRAALSEIIREVKRRQAELTRLEGGQFFVGQNVTFKDRAGREIQGSIQKINPKTIKVETRQGVWKVSPSLLSVA